MELFTTGSEQWLSVAVKTQRNITENVRISATGFCLALSSSNVMKELETSLSGKVSI